MSVWGWVGAVTVVSILFAVAWARAGRQIFRKSPAEQQAEDAAQVKYLAAYRRGER